MNAEVRDVVLAAQLVRCIDYLLSESTVGYCSDILCCWRCLPGCFNCALIDHFPARFLSPLSPLYDICCVLGKINKTLKSAYKISSILCHHWSSGNWCLRIFIRVSSASVYLKKVGWTVKRCLTSCSIKNRFSKF